jgi:DNA-binding MarR family transcriptional regulator
VVVHGASFVGGTNVGAANISGVGGTNNEYDLDVPANHHLPEFAPARIAQRPTWLISRAFVRSSGLLSAAFEAHSDGLRGYHYRLLAAIDEYGAASQADIGRSVSVDRSDVTAVLSELEARRLIERTIDPEHKRRKIVSLTSAGKQQLLALDAVVDKIQEDFLAPLTTVQRRQLVDLLRRLLAAE